MRACVMQRMVCAVRGHNFWEFISNYKSEILLNEHKQTPILVAAYIFIYVIHQFKPKILHLNDKQTNAYT